MVEQPGQVSFAQQRLWFLDQFEPGNCAYNLASAIRIRGILDIDALGRAFQAIVERHDSLRTTFTAVDGEVMALVCDAPEPAGLPLVSLDHVPEDRREEHALLIAAEEGQRRFDLSAGPLMRARLLRLSPIEHMLVLTMHHIVMDGWSIGVLLKEMAEFYDAFHANRPPEIPALPIQYSDFASWQRESLTAEAQARQLEYWKRTLDGAPAVLELPADRLRPAVQSHKGQRHSVRLDAALPKDVFDLSREERVTPFVVLLAAFETLLWRYTGVADFVLGTPMAGRSHIELEPLIGLFVNTIPLRANLSGDPTFRALLRRVHDTTIDAIANQDVPFEKLVEELRPERSMSHTPLFQTMFVLHNTPRTSLDFAGLHLEELELDSGLAKFDLTVEIFELDGLCCNWEYSTDLFDHPRITRMAGHFETLLRGICADPDRTLSALPILGAGEQNKVLVEWNATESAFPDGVSIHEAFEVQAARSADSIAVRSDDRHLTYQQLNDEANCLAHYLRRHGVQPQDRIAVAVERSADAIVALLAVMKTGASYVPIDPGYPKQRIDFMLKDSGARVLITLHRLRTRLPEHGGQTVFLDRDRAGILAESRLNPQVSMDCRCPAYVIYTSGSTGNPKGVLGTHRASMNRFAWMWKAYPFREGEVCAQRTSLSFVDSIAEIFGPLLQGVPIFVIPDDTVVDSDELVRQLATHRITRIVVVPSQLDALLDECPHSGPWLPTLRFCFTSGEALPYRLYARFTRLVPHAALVNLYGSSEVAADVTCFDTSSTSPRGFVPIGKPIANVRVYLLDPSLNPVPLGVPGEIYVAGDCLALGYLDRPELTAERFIADPFRPGGLLYKTGDLGRYHEDGNIEFLGRRDSQVKIRGLRIELGEIEAVLRTHDSVRHSAVLVRNAGAANHLLVAYVVPAEGQTVVHPELRRHLKTKLPDYMVPSAFVTMDALPMTPNGKLDQRALPAFDPARPQTPHGYVAPRNKLEETLIEIWAEVLKIERIGVLDNFFELGGHSLMAAQVIARVRKYVGVEVPVRSLFEEPTVAALASAVARARTDGATPSAPIVPGRSVRRTRELLEARLRGLSDEEIDALLTTALAHRAQGGQVTG
ncbi:MAG: amino acid adenylation domain-containing protein [Acidobacteriia bacterium]|nr:amino acid adenylation domain-containing protein [Terriglobia bacterium]